MTVQQWQLFARILKIVFYPFRPPRYIFLEFPWIVILDGSLCAYGIY